MKSIEEVYNERLTDHRLNTSYPLNPADWNKYRVTGKHPFSADETLSFYIHIPFCADLCTFCEYTRMPCPDESLQQHYLTVLDADIQTFIQEHPQITLQGFDIGGGTPTVLSERNFGRLMEIYQKAIATVKLGADYEPSIEGTFHTLTEDKLRRIAEARIHRLSLGLQTTSREVLRANHRTGATLKSMKKWMDTAKDCGIKKINLDFMFGLKGQTLQDTEAEIQILAQLNPEQITLYEFRPNMLGTGSYMTKDHLYQSYKYLYEGLTQLGYHARFGQNTFSKSKDDYGVSSYLLHRMLEGGSYKGFGMSAQSLNTYGISYNVGKNNNKLLQTLKLKTYNEEYTYHLPVHELLSKYLAISAYSGRFSLTTASDILGTDFLQYFKPEIDFCLEHGLMTQEDDILFITHEGFRNYGAVFSMFYKIE